jgi:hypothetical protein
LFHAAPRDDIVTRNASAALAKLMNEKKKTDIIDDFISKVQSHPTAMQKAQRIDDFEAVLRDLFASDDERAIELSDKVRDIIERKHVPLQKRISMLEEGRH